MFLCAIKCISQSVNRVCAGDRIDHCSSDGMILTFEQLNPWLMNVDFNVWLLKVSSRYVDYMDSAILHMDLSTRYDVIMKNIFFFVPYWRLFWLVSHYNLSLLHQEITLSLFCWKVLFIVTTCHSHLQLKYYEIYIVSQTNELCTIQ